MATDTHTRHPVTQPTRSPVTGASDAGGLLIGGFARGWCLWISDIFVLEAPCIRGRIASDSVNALLRGFFYGQRAF